MALSPLSVFALWSISYFMMLPNKVGQSLANSHGSVYRLDIGKEV
jgi:hypothetical protein